MKVTKRPDPSIFDLDEPQARKELVEKINGLILKVNAQASEIKRLKSRIDALEDKVNFLE